MSFFNKITQGAKSLFNKTGLNDPNLFRKAGNTARKIDNTVSRVGAFIKPIADLGGVGSFVDTGVNAVHSLRNNLERAINKPVSELRNGTAGIGSIEYQ